MKDNNCFDVIVIGSGIGGLYTALNIRSDLSVLIISKQTIKEGNSSLAQGGIAACIGKDDSFFLHLNDTLKAGRNFNDMQSLEVLIKESPDNIKTLINLGVPFDLDDEGNIRTTMEGGHSRKRILHAGEDATGAKIMDSLIKQVKSRPNITIFESTLVVDLLTENTLCRGVAIIKDDTLDYVYSLKTVIATGGIGSIYKNSTNSSVATGDGIAMAFRAGCQVENMEFIQFHPTALYTEGKGRRFLISETVRGEGAFLVNNRGDRFMTNCHPDMELAPRDVVSQGIYREMINTKSPCVFLDITHKDKNYIIKRFPTIYKKCLEKGLDISRDLIPVSPVQHYFIGGIRVDNVGRTSLQELYACGESASTRVHGANRLASNSLLECIVFGKRIAHHINDSIREYRAVSKDVNRSRVLAIKSNPTFCIEEEETENIIKDIMDKLVGIVRTKEGLLRAKEVMTDIYKELKEKPSYDANSVTILNMATVSLLIIKACINRKETLGCHLLIS